MDVPVRMTSFLSPSSPGPAPCPADLHAVYADMHDGDKKEVILTGTSMTIKPYENNEKWLVKAVVDTKSCSATVDFDVKDKPNPPPVPLTATFWFQRGGAEDASSNSFEFT